MVAPNYSVARSAVAKAAGLGRKSPPVKRGDAGRQGTRRRLPVDAFYAEHALVIEYRERQHTEAIGHFDKPNRMTVSGVHQGEQRRLYDNRRRELLPANGLRLVEIDWTCLASTKSGKLRRDQKHDKPALLLSLKSAGVEFRRP